MAEGGRSSQRSGYFAGDEGSEASAFVCRTESRESSVISSVDEFGFSLEDYGSSDEYEKQIESFKEDRLAWFVKKSVVFDDDRYWKILRNNLDEDRLEKLYRRLLKELTDFHVKLFGNDLTRMQAVIRTNDMFIETYYWMVYLRDHTEFPKYWLRNAKKILEQLLLKYFDSKYTTDSREIRGKHKMLIVISIGLKRIRNKPTEGQSAMTVKECIQNIRKVKHTLHDLCTAGDWQGARVNAETYSDLIDDFEKIVRDKWRKFLESFERAGIQAD